MPNQENKVSVAGFVFDSPQQGEQAKKELEAVEYLRNQVNWQNSQQLLQLYVQMITSEMFHTEIGIQFLVEIREHLLGDRVIDPYQIPDIPIRVGESVEVPRVEEQKSSSKDQTNDVSQELVLRENRRMIDGLKRKNQKYRQNILVQRAVILVFVILVIGMFGIQLTSTAPTILNYRTKVQDEYSEWEQELKDWEVELREREEALR